MIRLVDIDTARKCSDELKNGGKALFKRRMTESCAQASAEDRYDYGYIGSDCAQLSAKECIC